jgi:hypothetical protein
MNLTKEEENLILEYRKNKEETLSFKLRSLDSYSVEEKIDFFNRNFNRATSHITDILDGKYPDEEDDKQSLWEDVMTLLSHKNKYQEFWNYYNQICEER